MFLHAQAFQNSRDDLADELQAGRPRKSTLDNICQWEALYMRTDSPPTKKCKGNSLHIRASLLECQRHPVGLSPQRRHKQCSSLLQHARQIERHCLKKEANKFNTVKINLTCIRS